MGGYSLWKWPNFRISRARDVDLDLGSGHTAYRHASLVDLYLHTEFYWNRRNFLWTDGRTYGRADGYLRPTLLGRLGGVDVVVKLTECSDPMWKRTVLEDQLGQNLNQEFALMRSRWSRCIHSSRRNRYCYYYYYYYYYTSITIIIIIIILLHCLV